MERNCNYCVYHSSGSCAAWECTGTKTVDDIRADERRKVFEEIAEAFNEHLFDSPMMNPIMTRNEILLFLEQLKEQKNGTR